MDWASGPLVSRREFLAATALAGPLAAHSLDQAAKPAGRALIAISLDLEMSRNFPTWGQTHWDYEKGNLDAATKEYALEAARRVKARGGRIHFFALGQSMEQADVSWLRAIVDQGHPVGNHTYDHVNVKAKRLEDIQFRFRRAPWLIEGQPAEEVISANIRLADRALRERLRIVPAGFRTPGGFHDGLADRPDLQEMLLKQGYRWVSSKYPAHPTGVPGQPPAAPILEAIIAAQSHAQPFVYPSGLVEVPMSPISDVTAFRAGRWPLESFLEAIRAAVSWAIERKAVFCFLAHPSCLLVADPRFRAIELLCDAVAAAKDRAAIVDLDAVALRAKGAAGS